MKKSILLSSFAACALATSAYSQITVIEEAGEINYDGSFSINAEAGNVLVVATYRDGSNAAYNDITFGGNAATGSIVDKRVSLFYYIVDSTGDFDIASETSSNNSGIYVWELENVNTEISPVEMHATSATVDANITTTSANTFVVDAIGGNPYGSDPTAVSITPDTGGDPSNSTITDPADFSYEINLPTGGYLGGGTGTATTVGENYLGWNLNVTGGNLSDVGHLAYGFVPVPEPGTAAALVGLAALFSVAIRRRRH